MFDNLSNHIKQESKNCDGILNDMQNLFFVSYTIQFCLLQPTNYYQNSSEWIYFHCYTKLLPAMSALKPWPPLWSNEDAFQEMLSWFYIKYIFRNPKNTSEETHWELMMMEICTRGCPASWSLDRKNQFRVIKSFTEKN